MGKFSTAVRKTRSLDKLPFPASILFPLIHLRMDNLTPVPQSKAQQNKETDGVLIPPPETPLPAGYSSLGLPPDKSECVGQGLLKIAEGLALLAEAFLRKTDAKSGANDVREAADTPKPKAKRTRRTKEEIEAEKARRLAAREAREAKKTNGNGSKQPGTAAVSEDTPLALLFDLTPVKKAPEVEKDTNEAEAAVEVPVEEDEGNEEDVKEEGKEKRSKGRKLDAPESERKKGVKKDKKKKRKSTEGTEEQEEEEEGGVAGKETKELTFEETVKDKGETPKKKKKGKAKKDEE